MSDWLTRRAGLSRAPGPGGAAARLRERPAAAAHPVDADLLARRGQGRQGRDRPVRPGRPALHVEVRSGRRSSIGCRCRCFTALLGRRRGWLLFVQVLLAGAIVALGASDPQQDLGAAWRCSATLVAFLSASQDIIIDAYRVELLEERQQGAGAAAVVIGYRLAMLLAGAGALVIARIRRVVLGLRRDGRLPRPGHRDGLCAPEPSAAPPPQARTVRQRDSAGCSGRWSSRSPTFSAATASARRC